MFPYLASGTATMASVVMTMSFGFLFMEFLTTFNFSMVMCLGKMIISSTRVGLKKIYSDY